MVFPNKYFDFFIVFFVALSAGAFFDTLASRLPRRAYGLAATLLIAGTVASLFARNLEIQRAIFTRRPTPQKPVESFHQVRGVRMERHGYRPDRANAYLNLLAGVGTIDWFTAVPLAENATAKFGIDGRGREHLNPKYRGEAYFVGGEEATGNRRRESPDVHFTPNEIRVRVESGVPGRLVINQNFHRAWRSSEGTVEEYGGLLSVTCAAGLNEMELRYRPVAFLIGLAVSACFAAAGIAMGVFWRTERI